MKHFINIIIHMDEQIIPMVLPVGDVKSTPHAIIRRYVRNIARAMISLSMRSSVIVHISLPNGTHENFIVYAKRTEKF